MTPVAAVGTRPFATSGGEILRGSLLLLGARSLFPATAIVTAAILGRGLGPAGYATFAFAATVVELVTWLIGALFARAEIAMMARDGEGLALSMVRRLLWIGILSGAALAALAGPLGTLTGLPLLGLTLALLAIEVPLDVLVKGHGAVLSARGAFGRIAAAHSARWATRFVGVLLAMSAGLGLVGATVACLLAALAEAGLNIWQTGPLVKAATAPRPAVTPRAIASLLASLPSRAMLTGLVVLALADAPPALVGGLAAATALARLPGMVGSAVLSPILSVVAREGPAGVPAALGPLFRLLAASTPLVVLCGAGGFSILPLVFGREFASLGSLVGPLLAAGFLLLVPTMAAVTALALDDLREAAALGVGSLGAVLAAQVASAPFGPKALAWATLLATALIAALGLVRLHRRGVRVARGTTIRSAVLAALAGLVGWLVTPFGPVALLLAGIGSTFAVFWLETSAEERRSLRGRLRASGE